MSDNSKNTDERRNVITRRNVLAFAVQGLGVYAIANRARYLQVEEGAKFSEIADQNRIARRLEPASRGIIYDIKGRRVAENIPNFKVFYIKGHKTDPQAAVTKLASLIGISYRDQAEMLAKIENHHKTDAVTILEYLDYKKFAMISENLPSLPGIQTSIALSRLYPFTQLFAHSVGYVGRVSSYNLEKMENPHDIYKVDGAKIGKSGVELLLEEELRGQETQYILEKKPSGQVVKQLSKTNSVPGQDFQLTLDAAFQNYGLKRLEKESASAVIVDIETGDVKLMVSSPSFDPNPFVFGITQSEYDALQNNERHPLFNKSVSGQWPPGSTFKMVVALAGLEAGTIGPGSAVNCRGKINRGRDFHCWKRSGHGYIDLKGSLKHSCDIFYYQYAEQTGIDNIVAMAKKLGLGQKFDIPLNYQRAGLLGDPEWKKKTFKEENDQIWQPGDTFNAGIGQGFIEATPLQLAVMTARIASGKAVVPRLTRPMTENPSVDKFDDLGISRSSLNAVQQGMYAVSNESRGTAYKTRITGAHKWAGKTGTAQSRSYSAAERERGIRKNSQLPWEMRDHALFVAYAPYDKPKYAISVVVEHGGGGSAVAAPLARDLMLYALHDGPPPLSSYPAPSRGAAQRFINSVPELSEIMLEQAESSDPNLTTQETDTSSA